MQKCLVKKSATDPTRYRILEVNRPPEYEDQLQKQNPLHSPRNPILPQSQYDLCKFLIGRILNETFVFKEIKCHFAV